MLVLLDRNCLIALAENEKPAAGHLQSVIEAHRADDLELAVAQITASENQPEHEPASWEAFEGLLDRAGISDARLLPTIYRWGIGFWGKGLWTSEETAELERQIGAVLFPGFDLDDTTNWRRWVNRLCDVLTVWAHIWHKADVLLTNDARILRKRDALGGLGAAQIEAPGESRAC